MQSLLKKSVEKTVDSHVKTSAVMMLEVYWPSLDVSRYDVEVYKKDCQKDCSHPIQMSTVIVLKFIEKTVYSQVQISAVIV